MFYKIKSLNKLHFLHIIFEFLVRKKVRGSGLFMKKIRKHFIRSPEGEILIKTLHGFSVYIDPIKGKGIESSIYYKGTYERGTLFLMGYFLDKGDVFIDIGANIGLMSLHGSRLVGPSGKVYSFEPNPQTIAILVKNVRINGMKNIEIIGKALGAEKKVGNLHSRLDINRGAASLVEPEIKSDFNTVEVIRIDEYLNENEIFDIKLIKIDVEGYELEVLKGFGKFLSQKNSPIIIVECSEMRNNFNSSVVDLFNYLIYINGYKLFRLQNSKERVSHLIEIKGTDDLPSHDNIFCLLEHHLKMIDRRIF